MLNGEPIDLKALEKKAYRSTFQDGIWDIYFGLIILGISLGSLISVFSSELVSTTIILIYYGLIVVLLIIAKKKITVPRLGNVKFGPKRKKKKKELLVFLMLVMLLNLIMFILINLDALEFLDFIEPYLFFWVLEGLLFIIPLSIVAYLLEFRRLYLMSILIVFGLFMSLILESIVGSPLNIIYSYGSTGLIIISWGLYFLIKFINQYPAMENMSIKPSEGEVEDG